MNKLAAGRVPKHRRQVAEQFDKDVNRFHYVGVQAARQLSWSAIQTVLRAYRADKPNLPKLLRQELWKGVPLLAEGTAVCWLNGWIRSHELAGVSHRSLTLSNYDNAVSFLQKRLDLSTKQLGKIESRFNTQALLVYHGVSRKAEKILEKAVLDTVEQKMGVRRGTMRLQQAFEDAGIHPANSYTLENIYRTQTSLAYAAGRRWAEQRPNVQDRLEAYCYVTMGDELVRPAHALLEGVTLDSRDPFWESNTPPNGWSCRCMSVPIYDNSWEEVEAPEEAVDVDGEDVEAGPDEGWGFDPGAVFGDVMSEDEEGLSDWQEAARYQSPWAPSEEELDDLLDTLTPREKRLLAKELGVTVEDLEDGDLELAAAR